MALPIAMDRLIHGNVVESTRIEYKGGFNPNPILHTICAFANDIDNIGGGYIIIGIDEQDGRPELPPRGVDPSQIDAILQQLLNLCHLIEPLYQPIAEPIEYQDVWVIAIWVPGGHGRPYKVSKDVVAKDKSNKRYYIRKFSSTVIASADEEKELFFASSAIPFDDQPNLAAGIDDLSRPLLREHLRMVGSDLYEQSESMDTADIARSMQLVAGPPEDEHPRNVGILMFSERIETYFRYARIEVVDLPDPTGQSMTEQTFTGPIQHQLSSALSYISGHVIQRRTFKHDDTPTTEVVTNYPFAAVKEILSNAVYHRSYQISEPVVVRITPDAMEVTSFPGFDRSMSQESIDSYDLRCYRYRNRRIGDFLKELGLSEGRNTGFPKALAALEANGSPPPVFGMDEARGYLTVRIEVHPAFAPQLPLPNAREMEYRERVKNALVMGPCSLSELSRALGYKSIPKRLSKTVADLIAEGSIVRVAAGGVRSKLALVR